MDLYKELVEGKGYAVFPVENMQIFADFFSLLREQ